MRRIRELGMALGTEIEEQNELIDGINEKAGKTGAEVKRQDQQVREILGVSKKKKPSMPSLPNPTTAAAKAAVSSSNPFDGI